METVGKIRKMKTSYDAGGEEPVRYKLPIGDVELEMAELLGKEVKLQFTGSIACVYCGRRIKKSYQQGYCYPCLIRLARCDSCLIKPELCHYHQGTCREPEWGEEHCLTHHTVYLANSSALKVGITRGLEPQARWIDQGATQGLAIRTVATRLESGIMEVALKSLVADKTNWRRMLQGPARLIDLEAERDRLLAELWAASPEVDLPGRAPAKASMMEIRYPVLEYPTKIKPHDFDKVRELEGKLLGIKGQYLILDKAVVNIRKFGGYELKISHD